MSKVFVMHDADLGEVRYTDHKRYMWLLALTYPLIPLSGIALYFFWGTEWALLTPLVWSYGVTTVFDTWFGEDISNPPEVLMPELEADPYYRWLTYLTVPVHFLVLFIFAWFVGTQALSPLGLLVTAVAAGLYSGLGLVTAHELGHKKEKLEKTLAKLVLAVPAYGHFCVEHNRGHHRDVATPEDPASSRMGESIYRFVLREIPGAFRRAWVIERTRLNRQDKSAWHPENEILQSFALSAVIQIGLIGYFGWVMVPFLAIHNFWAWWQLTSANYIEHYGLLRQKDDNGRYERCQPHHSWNANHLYSNLALYHLERHSDHHAHPTRRYQSLRNYDDLPSLPTGYFGMFIVAYIPWWWYRIMDKRLLALPHVNGDLDKVNLAPHCEAALRKKYASSGGES